MNLKILSKKEHIVSADFFPENTEARWLVENYLYPSTGCISRLVSEVFSYISSRAGEKRDFNNMKPLVEFCLRVTRPDACTKGDEPELSHFIFCYEQIYSHIAACASHCIELDERKHYEAVAEKASKILDATKAVPVHIRFGDCFTVIYDSWFILSNNTYTYRALMDLMKMNNAINEVPNTIDEMCKIIADVSKSWD